MAHRHPRRRRRDRAVRARSFPTPTRDACAISPRPRKAERAAEKPPKHFRELFHAINAIVQDHAKRQSMSAGHDPVRIGLVATSDRASQGVYKDEGIPALEQWLAARAAESARVRAPPDSRRARGDRGDAEGAGGRARLPPRRHHRRHRSRGARRDARGHARGGRPRDARLRRADAPHQPRVRAHRDPLAAGGGDPQAR